MEIDIRDEEPKLPVINRIRITNTNYDEFVPEFLKMDGTTVKLVDTDGSLTGFDDMEMIIANKEVAENLIKALQKAIKLGWFDEI